MNVRGTYIYYMRLNVRGGTYGWVLVWKSVSRSAGGSFGCGELG